YFVRAFATGSSHLPVAASDGTEPASSPPNGVPAAQYILSLFVSRNDSAAARSTGAFVPTHGTEVHGSFAIAASYFSLSPLPVGGSDSQSSSSNNTLSSAASAAFTWHLRMLAAYFPIAFATPFSPLAVTASGGAKPVSSPAEKQEPQDAELVVPVF